MLTTSLLSADAVGDILQGLLRADFKGIPDAVADALDGLHRFADFRSAPDIGGLSGSHRSLSSYFPDLLAPFSEPTAADPIMAGLKALEVNFRRKPPSH